MIKKILIILFLLLWFSNWFIAYAFYPDVAEVHKQWDGNVYLREKIYEGMMLLLLVLSFLTPTRSSRTLIAFAVPIVLLDIVDKFSGIRDYAATDIIVILFSVFMGILVYKNNFRFDKL